MPKKTPDHVITEIQNLWADKDNPKAKDVLADYESNFWRKDPNKWRRVGLRRVQEIISARRLGGDGQLIPTFERKKWKPWCPNTDPETNAFLLSMNSVCQAVQRRFLYDHEADWGMRLRVALTGLTPYDQFCFVTLYAIRKVRAYYAEAEPFTADLDEILAYKPWLPESAHGYGMATVANLVPQPPAGARDEISFEDAVDNRFTGKAWDTLRVDLRLPWYIYPEEGSFLKHALSTGTFGQVGVEKFTLEGWEHRARDTAIQFWMGNDPIFEKPTLHGMVGLIELRSSDANLGELNGQEEAIS